MEPWIIFAIISAVFAGLYSFTLKVVAHYHLDPEKSLLFASLMTFLLSGGVVLFSSVSFAHWQSIIALSCINGISYYIATLTRIHSLRHIHTTIYFPIYKTLGPILATLVGVYYFRDQLTSYEMIGIILGIIVPLLLISKSEDAIQNNLRKGLSFLGIGAIMTVLTASASKFLNVEGWDQQVYLFFSFTVLAISATIRYFSQKHKENNFRTHHFWSVTICAALLNFAAFYTFIKALEGDLSVAFTINAFSIIIPIVLSVWFFKEHMNVRKAVVIVLSIVSVIFFAF